MGIKTTIDVAPTDDAILFNAQGNGGHLGRLLGQLAAEPQNVTILWRTLNHGLCMAIELLTRS